MEKRSGQQLFALELVLELVLGLVLEPVLERAAAGLVPKRSLFLRLEFEKSVSVVAQPASVWRWSSYDASSESRMKLSAHSPNPAFPRQPMLGRTRACRLLTVMPIVAATLCLAVVGAEQPVPRQEH